MNPLRDTALVFIRAVRITAASPAWAVLQLIQPLLYLLLFGPLLIPVASLPGFPPGGAYNVLVPGLLVLLTMFGTLFVGFGLIGEIRSGLLERLRVTPLNRTAVLAGRALRDTALLLAQSLLLLALALPLGLHIDLLGLVVLLGLLALLALALASLSYTLALKVANQDAFAPLINSLTLPLLLLSGILLPLSLAPNWLQNLAVVNPLSHTVEAARALVSGHLTDPAVPLGFAVTAALAIVCLTWATHTFTRTST